MFKFNLYDRDKFFLEDCEEIPSLIDRKHSELVSDYSFMGVCTKNIQAIISRQEIMSILHFTKPSDLINYSIISITDPFQEKLATSLDINCKDLIQLEFTDIRGDSSPEYLEKKKDSITPISQNQIDDISKFILKNKDSKFIVHCEAGGSRSPAIAILIETLLGNEEGALEINNHFRYTPNIMIMKMLGLTRFL